MLVRARELSRLVPILQNAHTLGLQDDLVLVRIGAGGISHVHLLRCNCLRRAAATSAGDRNGLQPGDQNLASSGLREAVRRARTVSAPVLGTAACCTIVWGGWSLG